MLFNSFEFAIFLPIVFVLFWFVANRSLRHQNILLLIASYIFYGWWDWRFLSLLAFTSTFDYFVGLHLFHQTDRRKRKILFLASIGINLTMLGFFKYYDFFADSFAEAFTFFGYHVRPNSLHIILPVGISFYTFQSMSYAIDIYRGKLTPSKDLIGFLAFVSFFPQLVAGPIERASNLLPQFFIPKTLTYNMLSQGFKLMLWGFFMKVAVADRLSLYVDAVYGHVALHTGWTFIVATFFFAVEIYSDFGGYSLIALGCAQLFGFQLMVNFRRPYFSGSMREFWSRWHISLSTWFKDYVYIPLGGNRGTKGRNYLNLFITFVISGLWHGANWTFVIWGAIHGILQVAEREISGIQRFKIPRLLRIAFVFACVCFAWIFFRAATVADAFHIVHTIFINPGSGFYTGDIGIFSFSILSILLLISADSLQEFRPEASLLHHKWPAVRLATILLLLVYIVSLGLFDGSHFIYFQF